MVKDIVWRFMLSSRAGSFVRTMSWITVVAITISIAALILIVSVMNGFNNSMLNNIVIAEPDLVIVHDDKKELIPESLMSFPVHSIQNVTIHDVIVKTYEDNFGGAIAKGMSSVAVNEFLSGLKGSSKKISELGENEVLLGVDLARALGVLTGEEIVVIPPDALIGAGAEDFIYDKMTVKDTFTTQVENLDQNVLIYDKDKSIKAASLSRSFVAQTEVQLFDPFNASKYKKKLVAGGFNVETWEDRNAALTMALKLEKITMTTFLSLGAVITSFSVATVLILLINQKKSEWGIFMTMGLSRRRTRNLFIRIGAYLSFIGIVSGFLIGSLLALFLKIYKPCILPEIYYDCTVPVDVKPHQLGLILIASIVITLLASYIPAQVYSKLKPSQSIKT